MQFPARFEAPRPPAQYFVGFPIREMLQDMACKNPVESVFQFVGHLRGVRHDVGVLFRVYVKRQHMRVLPAGDLFRLRVNIRANL